MAKISKSYSCTSCGLVTNKWAGRCDGCGDWNTIHESKALSNGPQKVSIGIEKGEKIGIISYKSLFLANEIEVNEKLNLQLRKCGLSPKTFFISTLKDHIIQKKLIDICKKEDIKLIITYYIYYILNK